MKQFFSRLISISVFFSTIFLSGCTSQPVRFNTEDSKYFDLANGGPTRASGCGFQLLSIIPIEINSRQQRAVDELHSRGDFYFGEIQIQEVWRWAFIGTVHCTNIIATAYPRLPDSKTR